MQTRDGRTFGPRVQVRAATGQTRAVVLVLHGGKERSRHEVTPRDMSVRRMRPFAGRIHRQSAAHGVAVWSIVYSYRGWNGEEMSPVPDARWALQEVRREHGEVPVVLLGHSMGGRTAVRVLDDPSVVAMVALAPWLPDEPVDGVRGRRVAVLHGTLDHTTSARRSRDWADRARPLAEEVTFVGLRGVGHFMLRRIALWSDLTTGFVLTFLGLEPTVGAQAREVLARVAAGESTFML